MSEAPVTFAEAAALVERLLAAQRAGATLLLDGAHVINRFEHWPEAQQMDVTTTGNWCQSFYRPYWSMTAAEFAAHWRGRITVLRPAAWPGCEIVDHTDVDRALGTAEKPMAVLSAALSWNAPLERETLQEMAEASERLASVCRTFAKEQS